MDLRPTICAALAMLAAACTTTTTTTVTNEGVSKTTPTRSTKVTEADLRTRVRARTDLAAGYYRNGQLAVALEEARRAAAIDANYAEVHGLLGLIYMDMKEQREAEESFQRALKLDAANSELNNNYGYFLCNTGRERASIEYFNVAIRDPLYRTPARANQNAGACLMRIKDYEGAERYLRRSFELDAGVAVPKFLLSRLYLATNQVEKATFYYNVLAKSVESSAESLWLGLRVARANADLRTETQLANELKQRFPQSPEAAALARGDFDE
ncbi:MAG TPA: type IV pilus biogenesis/stability protein PilW [Burkholderiaceae bacterium]|nr:type IV pilus biogenesis/stability protein PilW [Burkholderiaceae bacterium]